jgi:hypothetical protein
VKSTFQLALLFFAFIIQLSGQLVGSCPSSSARSPQDIKELRGVVVDENLAVVPKVKVKLQVPVGQDFHDVALIETDRSGQFSFEGNGPGQYRLVFAGLVGLCPATIPVRYGKTGLKGIRLTLPVAATDTCPQYCEGRLKIEEMSGREGRE